MDSLEAQRIAVLKIQSMVTLVTEGKFHHCVPRWDGVFSFSQDAFANYAEPINITPVKVNFPGLRSDQFKIKNTHMPSWKREALSYAARRVCEKVGLVYETEVGHLNPAAVGRMLEDEIEPKFPIQLAEFYFDNCFVTGNNAANYFDTLQKMVQPSSKQQLGVTKERFFYCYLKQMFKAGYAKLPLGVLPPAAAPVLSEMGVPNSSVGIWNGKHIVNRETQSSMTNKGAKPDFIYEAIVHIDEVFYQPEFSYERLPYDMAFINKISVKPEKRGPFDDRGKVRFIYLSSIVQYLVDQCYGKSMSQFLRHKGEIHIGEKWRGDGMSALYSLLHKNADGKELDSIEGDISRMDLNQTAFMVGFLTCAPISLYSPTPGNEFTEERAVRLVAHSADWSSVKLMYDPHTDAFMLLSGVLASGSFGTSFMQSQSLRIMFEDWFESAAEAAEKDGERQIAEQLRRGLSASMSVLGDDNVGTRDPVVRKYLNIKNLEAIMKKWQQVLKFPDSKEFLDRESFVTNFKFGSVDLKKVGPKFLKRYCVRGATQLVRPKFLPVRPIEDYFIRAATTTSTIDDPLSFLLVLSGLADDNMGTNHLAHLFLQYCHEYTMSHFMEETEMAQAKECMKYFDKADRDKIPYGISKLLASTTTNNNDLTYLEMLEFPSRDLLLHRFSSKEKNVPEEKRGHTANPHPAWVRSKDIPFSAADFACF